MYLGVPPVQCQRVTNHWNGQDSNGGRHSQFISFDCSRRYVGVTYNIESCLFAHNVFDLGDLECVIASERAFEIIGILRSTCVICRGDSKEIGDKFEFVILFAEGPIFPNRGSLLRKDDQVSECLIFEILT